LQLKKNANPKTHFILLYLSPACQVCKLNHLLPL